MSDALDAYKIQPSDLRPVLFSSMLAHRLEWEQRYISPLGEDLGWREVVGDSLEICYLRCSNGTMFIDPHVRHLAAELRIRLAKAQSPRRMRAA